MVTAPPRFDAIVAACDRFFATTGLNFSRQLWNNGTGVVYQIDPLEFAARYPHLHVEQSYGSGWSPLDIEFWFDYGEDGHLRVAGDGRDLPELLLDPADGEVAMAAAITAYFRRLIS